MPLEELTTATARARQLVVDYPGLHLRELARRLDLDVRAARHHLNRLEKSGYVTALRLGGFVRYFPRRGRHQGEMVDRKDKRMLGQLRNPIALSLVIHLMTSGPIRLTELSGRAEISPSRATFHLRKLEKEGIVLRRSGEGSEYDLEDPEKLKELLRAYRPMPDQVEGLLDLWDDFVGTE